MQVLQQDNKNVPTLANLAAIQLDLDHLEAAEINIKQAVALAPDDPYSLFVLGRLRFRQKKYDEAMDALSRAAKLDPAGCADPELPRPGPEREGPARPGRDRPAQGHPARSRLRQRAQQPRGGLHHPAAAAGGAGALALPKGPGRRPAPQPGAGEDARSKEARRQRAVSTDHSPEFGPGFRTLTLHFGLQTSACSARLCMR